MPFGTVNDGIYYSVCEMFTLISTNQTVAFYHCYKHGFKVKG